VPILILGASARAAAFSARRAGLRTIAADLFADRDLRGLGPAGRIAAADYPGGLAERSASAPSCPWIYTGGLENHPDLVARIARQRPLWGNDGPVLRAVRDPIALATILRRAGFPCPAARLDATGLPRDGSWLVKPLGSAGGWGIVPLGAEAGEGGPIEAPRYYQERLDGPSLGAVFVAARGGGESRVALAGVTRQWIGRRGCPFAYVGSLGPWPIAPRVRARIDALGRALADAFGLVGLFGVDLILRDGEPWPLEVNPRYTASVEVLELALGRPLLAEHARACDPDAAVAPASPGPRGRPRWVGKRIVFAPTRCRFPGVADPAAAVDPFDVPRWADLPDPGAHFEAGEPVLTLFTQGPTAADCRLLLRQRRARWLRRLRQSS
jgi:predicted ATP-grasp superfamily ATP-dependent carboligase